LPILHHTDITFTFKFPFKFTWWHNCSSQLQQHLNVFQAIVNIWIASGMCIFAPRPTLILDNIHHTSCHLLHTSAAQTILCFKTKAQLGGMETTLTFSTSYKRYYMQNRLWVRSRIFCLSGFIQYTHDNNSIWILHFPSMPLHYVKIHKADKALSETTWASVCVIGIWRKVWEVQGKSDSYLTWKYGGNIVIISYSIQ
jgi:hypothetical protein